ncbi:MAG: ABC transporter permease [Paludibacteraceae bacterium]|nr:ABC transporter permease [Paludibacteraceae bacterium]
MNYSNLIKVSTRALLRNKFRSFLTMLGIIIGIGSVIAMLAIGQGSKLSIENQVSSMGSNMVMVMPSSQSRGGVQLGNDDSKKLTVDDAKAISEECDAVSLVSPEVRSSGQVIYAKSNAPSTIYGVSPEYLDIKKTKITDGRIFTDKEVRSAAKVCLLGKTVIKNLFGENVNPIGYTIRFKSIPMQVIGVLEPKGENSFGQDQDDVILAPYSTVQKRILAITHVQTIVTSALSEAASADAMTQIETVLRTRHKLKTGDANDFEVRSQAELVKMFTSISDMLSMLLGAIAGISLLIGGIGIMNIMYVSVTERTREIGLRMAIGAQSFDILMQFLSEAMLLSVVGGIIGIILGISSAKIITSLANWPTVVTSNSVIMSFLVCTVIGIFFGWYPAQKASRLDPIDALRYE